MKRWIPVAVVAAALFVINVIGRVAAAVFVDADDTGTQNLLGIVGAGVMTVAAIGVGVWWSMRMPMQSLIPRLGSALLLGTLAAVLLGPLTVGGNPFAGGAGLVLAELAMFAALLLVGAFLGYLGATVAGADYRGRNLKRVERHYGRKGR